MISAASNRGGFSGQLISFLCNADPNCPAAGIGLAFQDIRRMALRIPKKYFRIIVLTVITGFNRNGSSSRAVSSMPFPPHPCEGMEINEGQRRRIPLRKLQWGHPCEGMEKIASDM